MKNKIFVLVVAVVAVGGFFLLKLSQKTPPATDVPQTASAAANFVRPHSPSFGNMMGKVTVVEWFDPECEACRAVHPFVKKIIADYKDRVHFVYRYMPYHRNSMYAATALEEAREHDKFEQALDLIFEKQPEWGDHHQPRPELIPEYLTKLGIAKDKLDQIYLDKKHSLKIRMDEEDGKSVGVRVTPTFFVNGQMLHELGDEPLRAMIDAALKSGN